MHHECESYLLLEKIKLILLSLVFFNIIKRNILLLFLFYSYHINNSSFIVVLYLLYFIVNFTFQQHRQNCSHKCKCIKLYFIIKNSSPKKDKAFKNGRSHRIPFSLLEWLRNVLNVYQS